MTAWRTRGREHRGAAGRARQPARRPPHPAPHRSAAPHAGRPAPHRAGAGPRDGREPLQRSRAACGPCTAMGVIHSRQGAGTFIQDGPPSLDSQPLGLLAALHGFSRRRDVRGARRARGRRSPACRPQRASRRADGGDGRGSGEHVRVPRRSARVPASTTCASTGPWPPAPTTRSWPRSWTWSRRSSTSGGARRSSAPQDLRESAEMHRRIYQAIRRRDADAARDGDGRAPATWPLGRAGPPRTPSPPPERRAKAAPRARRTARNRRGELAYTRLEPRRARWRSSPAGPPASAARSSTAWPRPAPTWWRPRGDRSRSRTPRPRSRRGAAAPCGSPSDVTDRAVARGGARARRRAPRQGRHPGQLRRPHQAPADPRDGRGRLGRHPRHQPDSARSGPARSSAATCSSAATAASSTSRRSRRSWRSSRSRPTPPARRPWPRLTKSLAVEWGPRGVNVNAIAPGVFPTDLNRALLEGTDRGQEFLARTPLKRFGRVEELAGAAVFLASDAASFVNGEVLVVDGGFLASGVNQ